MWLDESGTYWVIKGGLWRAADTGLRYHGQPLYYVLQWTWRVAFGEQEWILRIPSALSMALAAFLLYRIATALFDGFTAAVSVLAFLSLRDVAFAAADARPYAAAMASGLAATLMLLKLTHGSRGRTALGYCVLAAMTVHLHFFFGLMLVAQAAYLLRSGRWRAIQRNARVIMAVGLPLLMLPALSGFLDFASRQETLGSTSDVQPIAVLIVPLVVAALLVLVRSRPWADTGLDEDALVFTALWAVIPPAALYVASAAGDSNVFQARYALSSAPGLALLIGVTLRTIPARAFGFTIAAVLLVATGVTSTRSEHWVEDWRSVQEYIASQSEDPQLLLVRAGLVESTNIEWLDDEEKISYLTAPLSYYRVPGRIVALPYDASPAGLPFLESIAGRAVEHGRRFLVITNYSHLLDDWFRHRFRDEPFDPSPRRDFGEVSVTVFQPATG